MPEVLEVDSSGTIRALAPGRATVRLTGPGEDTGPGGEDRKEFRILPPVADYHWEPRDTTILVGETVQLWAVARDSSGAIVARLTEAMLSHGDSSKTIEVVTWSDSGLVLRGVAPGVARTHGRLGDRFDSAMLRVIAQHSGGELDPGLVRSFAGLVDSVSFGDARYGWSECCWQTWLVLRPHGTWTFVRVDSTVHWFEAAADSATFRAVTTRLVQLGFAAGWPTSFGDTLLDTPRATLTLRAPGQCHQTSASPYVGGRPLPREWRVARAILDSLATHVVWQVRSPPQWAVVDRYRIGVRFICGSEAWFR